MRELLTAAGTLCFVVGVGLTLIIAAAFTLGLAVRVAMWAAGL